MGNSTSSASFKKLQKLSLLFEPRDIVEAMKKYHKYAEVQEKGCGELGNLALMSDENRYEIANAGGIAVILGAMKTHQDRSGVQEFACEALGNLAVNEQNRISIAEANGIVAIIAAMKKHKNHPLLQNHACGALANLAITDQNKIAIAEAAGIPAIIAAMKRHRNHALVQNHACSALRRLAANDRNKLTIAIADGIPAIIAAMNNHTNSAGVQQQACGALRHLSSSNDDSKSNKSIITNSGGIDAIQAALQNHPNRTGVQEQGSSALRHLGVPNMNLDAVPFPCNSNGTTKPQEQQQQQQEPNTQSAATTTTTTTTVATKTTSKRERSPIKRIKTAPAVLTRIKGAADELKNNSSPNGGSTTTTTASGGGLQLLEDVAKLRELLHNIKGDEDGNIIDDDNEKGTVLLQQHLDYCVKQNYPSPNIFKMIPLKEIINLLLCSDQEMYQQILIDSQTLLDKMKINIKQDLSVLESQHPIAIKPPIIMDHTIHLPGNNTPYGHTAEVKYQIWKMIRAIGCKSIALTSTSSGLYHTYHHTSDDSYTIEEQFLELLHQKEGRDGMMGGFVICGPHHKDRATARRCVEQYEVPNVFLDVTTLPSSCSSSAEIENNNNNGNKSIISAIGDAIIEALKDFDNAFNSISYPNAAEISGSPVGQVYINFVNLMECLDLPPDKGIYDHTIRHNPTKRMQNKDNVQELENLFDRIKQRTTTTDGDDNHNHNNNNNNHRVTAICFREEQGRAYHSDYSCIAQWLRKHFPSPQYQILVHAHGGTGTEQAASLDSVAAGADGVYAGFIPQAAATQGGGHNSYFLYLHNLISNGNNQVWKNFELHTGMEVAKMIYALNFNSINFPGGCPIWGNHSQKFCNTEFSVTTEGEWKSQSTQEMYNQWEPEDIVQFGNLRKSLAAIEGRIDADQPSVEQDKTKKQQSYKVMPLATTGPAIGRRMDELGLIDHHNPDGQTTTTKEDAIVAAGDVAKKIMIATMNAGIRVNYDDMYMLTKLASWVEALQQLHQKKKKKKTNGSGTALAWNRSRSPARRSVTMPAK